MQQPELGSDQPAKIYLKFCLFLFRRKAPFRQKRSSASQPKTVRGLLALKALASRRPAAGRKMLSTVGAQFQVGYYFYFNIDFTIYSAFCFLSIHLGD